MSGGLILRLVSPSNPSDGEDRGGVGRPGQSRENSTRERGIISGLDSAGAGDAWRL